MSRLSSCGFYIYSFGAFLYFCGVRSVCGAFSVRVFSYSGVCAGFSFCYKSEIRHQWVVCVSRFCNGLSFFWLMRVCEMVPIVCRFGWGRVVSAIILVGYAQTAAVGIVLLTGSTGHTELSGKSCTQHSFLTRAAPAHL